jgi:hypothetical protein
MNSELKKYLSDVFRKELNLDATNSRLISEKKMIVGLPDDRNNNKFVLDGKYKLRLDEII